MSKIRVDKNDTPEEKDEKEQVALKMLKYLYDTPESLLPELSDVPETKAPIFALQVMFQEALKPDRKPGTLPQIYRINYLKFRRSVKGTHLGGLRLLVSSVIGTTEEDTDLDEGHMIG